MYNKKILFSIPPIDFIGMNTSNWTLKIICVVDRRVFLVHTWIKGKTKMMAKSTVTQSPKSFIAAPFISQNAGLASWSSSQVLLVCCWDKWPLSDEFQNTKQQQTQNRYLTTPPENYTQLNTTTIQMSWYVHTKHRFVDFDCLVVAAQHIVTTSNQWASYYVSINKTNM